MSKLSSKSSFNEIFKNTVEIEKMVGKEYEKLAELFSNLPKIADFCNEMCKDEVNQAKWLLEIKDSLSQEQLLSSPDAELILKVQSIKNLLDKYLTKKIHNLDDAYEFTNDIEFSGINNLFRFFTHKFVSSEDKKRFTLSEVTRHQLRIMDFPEEYGDRVVRKSIKAEEN